MPVVDSDRTRAAKHLSPVAAGGSGIPSHPLGRVYLFVAGLLAEYAVIAAIPHPWSSLHREVAGAIVFVAVFVVVAHPSLKPDRASLPLNLRLLPVYLGSLLLIAATHAALLLTSWARLPLEIAWFTAIPCSAVALFCILIPPRALPSLLRRTRVAVLYAAVAAFLVIALKNRVAPLWDDPHSWSAGPMQRATFHLVGHVLGLFYPQVLLDPASYTIGLPHFAITVAASCSGVEGLCLTLLFSVGWLWYARRELRFPQAFLLVPTALALIWTLNIFRIATLLMIGNSGHPMVALLGFHAEAGWIAFNAVTLGFLLAAHHVPWLVRSGSVSALHQPAETGASPTRNVAAIYLVPFLAILASAMISKAASSGFEWAYPLRFFAAAAVLWHYRAEYRRIDWTFTWRGPLIGALVFAMWLGLSHWTFLSGPSSPTTSSLGATLAAMRPARRIVWLTIRVAAAVLTVPIAEELAFRGFLLRRLVSADVESVAYRSVTPLAILLSSIAFGLMHGRLWLAGIVAGAAYALVLRRTNRLGEAAAAHATTNLLLAVWVLTRGDWGLW
ncbi:MAG TPA: exosortase E/protease, VPEID-CTERM system [Terracidiphilus sp.]|nr:exosortase E/protease, VPEID-CTERM system [Terracidiphilus sp.]